MLSFVTPIFGVYRDASNNGNTGLFINVDGVDVEAKLNMKGKVNFNSNSYGMYSILESNNNLEINVETSGATLNSCGNFDYDIEGSVHPDATLTFTGAGSYTCSSKQFIGDGTIVPPGCQDCLSN